MCDSEDQGPEFLDDDGTEFDPEMIPKPKLCKSCKKDGDPKEEILCTLNRMDQQDNEGQFKCEGFEKKGS